MPDVRPANLSDLAVVASWISSDDECRIWCGTRVAYPIELDRLPGAIEFEACESWVAAEPAGLVAFGQLVPKPLGRLHLARLISAPDRRGEGFGRLITAHLLKTALSEHPSSVSLNVFSENQAALALYRSLGFLKAERPPSELASESIYMEYGGHDGDVAG